MKDVPYRGYTIERERIETATRGYTEYTIRLSDGTVIITERLFAAKFAVDGDIAGESAKPIVDDIKSDGVYASIVQKGHGTASATAR